MRSCTSSAFVNSGISDGAPPETKIPCDEGPAPPSLSHLESAIWRCCEESMKFGFLSLMRRRPEIGWGCRFFRLSVSVKQAISNPNNAGSSLMSAAIPYVRQLPIENARWERRYDRFADARFLFRISA